MGFLSGLFNPSKNTNRGYGQAIDAYNKASEQTNPFYNSALQGGTQATGRLQDFLGLNGTGAQTSALNTWQQGPAAETNRAAGLKAIEESAAARGMSLSGDAMKSLQQYGQDNYNQNYQQHLSNLSGLIGGGYNAAAGINSNASQLGNLYVGQGRSMDAGNRDMAGNILGIAGTAFGRLF